MADVNVTFAAQDALSPEIAKLQAELKNLQPPPLLGASGTQYQVVGGNLQVLGQDFRKVKEEAEEMGEGAQRAGINVESMIERMAVRMVVFEALRLAIQGIKLAFDEFSKNEQVRIQFDALSTSAEHLDARFEALREAASKALMPIDQAEKLRETLIDLGATEESTVWLTRELGQWSHVLGIDSERLATALGHVAQGQGSLQEMRLVTRMMGDQREAGLQLIQTYENLEKAQKALEAENKTVAQSMDAVLRATKEMGEEVNRTRSRSAEFLKQTGVLQQITPQLPTGAAGGWVTYTPPAGASPAELKALDQQVIDYIKQYQAGLAELKKRYGYQQPYSQIAGLYGIPQPPSLNPDYVMRVGKEAQEDQQRQLDQKAQADREHQNRMQEQGAIQTQAAKADLATLPQAVTGPPAAVWDAWKGSLEGLKAQAKENTNEMIKGMWDSTKPLADKMDRAAAANENVYNLLSGASGT